MADTGTGTDTSQTETVETLFEATIAGEKIQLPEKIKVGDKDVSLKDIVTKSATGARKDAESRLNKRIEELQGLLQSTSATKDEIASKLQQIEDEKLTASEKAQKEIERSKTKYENEIKAATTKAEEAQRKYEANLIESQIYGGFGGFDLFSPQQTMTLVRTYGQPKVVSENGVDRVVLSFKEGDQVLELSPREFMQKYLTLPENQNQLKASLKPGGGSSQTGARMGNDGALIFGRKQIATDAKAAEEYRQALKARKEVRIDENA